MNLLIQTTLQPYNRENIKQIENELAKAPYCLKFTYSENDNQLLINTTKFSDIKNNMVKECGGIILDIDNNYDIIYWNGYIDYDGLVLHTSENIIIENENNFLETKETETFVFDGNNKGEINTNDNNKMFLTKYLEGTLIKVYFNKNKGNWNIGTNQGLNAYEINYKGTKTFGEYFEELIEEETIEEYFKTLNKDINYTYILTLNKINTINENKSQLNLVSTFNTKKHTFNVLDTHLISNNNNEIIEILKNYNKNCIENNYILVVKKENWHYKYKILSPIYKKYCDIMLNTMTNEPYNRLIELYAECNIKMIKYAYLNDSNISVYKNLKNDIKKNVYEIFNLYKQKYMYHTENLVIPKKYKHSLYLLHSEYIKNKKSNSCKNIGIKDVYNMIQNMTAKDLKYVLL